MKNSAWLSVCLERLKSNIKIIQEEHQKKQLCCVVKANAYGCGMHTVAHFLRSLGQDVFAVANLNEALSLRSSGLKGRIIVLGGADVNDWQLYAQHEIEACLISLEQMRLLIENLEQKEKSLKKPMLVQLKIDTGMYRFGILEEPDGELIELLQNPLLKLCGIFSHLSCADVYGHPNNELQRVAFLRWVELFSKKWQGKLPELHLANSGGLMHGESFHFDRARIGFLMWSSLDFSPNLAISINDELQQVCSLHASVLQVKRMIKEGYVGYNAEYLAKKGETIAVVGMGYGDGYRSSFAKQGQVMINGRRRSVAGRIGMGLLSISLGKESTCQVGDLVTLYGGDEVNGISLNEVAALEGITGTELMVGTGMQVKRAYSLGGQVYQPHLADSHFSGSAFS